VYRFSYFDDSVKSVLSDRDTYWDIDLQQELAPVLDILKKTGEIAGANCGFKPGISLIVYELKGKYFQITYTVDPDKKEVRFYEFYQISNQYDWESLLETDFAMAEEKSIYIPQIGDHHKYIEAINLIKSGVDTARNLGIAFKSGAIKDKDLVRRGDYLGRPLLEMGLATRRKVNRNTPSTYVLTKKGEKIAKADNYETAERLFAEALLGFYPI
jgi:hypothetical protein